MKTIVFAGVPMKIAVLDTIELRDARGITSKTSSRATLAVWPAPGFVDTCLSVIWQRRRGNIAKWMELRFGR